MTLPELFGLLFAVIGAAIVAWSLWNLTRAAGSRKWSTTEGIVVVSDLQRSQDSDGGLMYRSEISYRYTANGHEFISSRTRFGDGLSLSWSSPAAKTVHKYPSGKVVLVYFDPHDPGEAVLEPGVSASVFAGLVFGVLFVLFGLAAVAAA